MRLWNALKYLWTGKNPEPAPQAEKRYNGMMCKVCGNPLEVGRRSYCSDKCAAQRIVHREIAIKEARENAVKPAEAKPIILPVAHTTGEQFATYTIATVEPVSPVTSGDISREICEEKAEEVKPPRPCIVCGKELAPIQKKYCGVYCRTQYYADHTPKQEEKSLKGNEKYAACIVCQTPLTGNQEKYCSEPCRNTQTTRNARVRKSTLKTHVVKPLIQAMPSKDIFAETQERQDRAVKLLAYLEDIGVKVYTVQGVLRWFLPKNGLPEDWETEKDATKAALIELKEEVLKLVEDKTPKQEETPVEAPAPVAIVSVAKEVKKRKERVHVPVAERELILRSYKQGNSLRDIAMLTKYSREKIRDIIHEAGIMRDKGGRS